MHTPATATTDTLTPERLMAHLRAIAALGPRPTTGDAERQAARYVREQLEALGIGDIREQRLKAPDTYGWRIIPATGMTALGALLGGGGRWGKLTGAALMLGGTWALHQAESGKPVVPVVTEMGTSQNVFARLPPTGETRHFLYLVAHLDTNKQRFSMPLPIPITTHLGNTIELIFNATAVLSLLWGALRGRRGATLFEKAAALVSLAGLAWLLFDETQPFVEGANDNASAVAVLLALAETLKAAPLEHTEVVFLFTGAEETLSDGIQSYLDLHAPPRDFSTFVDFEMVGAGDICYVTRHGINAFASYRPTPKITALAAQTVRKHPGLLVSGKPVPMVDKVAVLVREGYEAICITGTGDDGMPPNWHRVTDTVEHIEADTLLRAAQFGLALAQAVDAKASA